MLVLLLGLLGCQPDPLCIETTSDRASAVQVSVHEGQECNQPTRLKKVEVRLADGTLMWSLMVRSGTEVKVTDLRYGVVPEGATGSEPKPLEPGMDLTFTVEGITGAGASAKIAVKGGGKRK